MKITREKKYQTWAGWKRAAKEAGATLFEGDKDIAQAFGVVDPSRSSSDRSNLFAVGEWDGVEGSVYTYETAREMPGMHDEFTAPNPSVNRKDDQWLGSFGRAVLVHMQNSPEWNADTFELVQAAAEETGLVRVDRDGFLRVKGGPWRATSRDAQFGLRVLKDITSGDEWDVELFDNWSELAMKLGLSRLSEDKEFVETSGSGTTSGGVFGKRSKSITSYREWVAASREAGASRIEGNADAAVAFTSSMGRIGVWTGKSGFVHGVYEPRQNPRRSKVTSRDFSMGAVEHHGELSVTKRHGAYIVLGFAPDGTHVNEGFKTLELARAFASGVNRSRVRSNPLRRLPGESERDFMARCMSAEKKKFPRQDQRVAVCLSKARRNPTEDLEV